ncbi:MAG: nucleotidyltransferase family protein [Proteobacteria bacterium]|nr:nucleotidyltransferase family protein [Pseudomonadota bacterium]MBU1057517.1 nucleotidyltransferase family protein [Pseudomonadota bacterium]
MSSGGNIRAIILAAGTSSRMGRPKQLLQVEGECMLDHAIAAAQGAGAAPPVLILGAFAEEILRGARLATTCEIHRNQEYGKGQASSLVAGVQAVAGRCDAAIFLLTDQPFIDAQLVAGMTALFAEKRPDILYPLYRKQRGNPVIISSSLFPRLLTARGDKGARFLFTDKSLDILEYEVDNAAVVTDIDTLQDYAAILLYPFPSP